MDQKLKHLECIQGVINRLASDSFRMKGWCVVLVAALFVLLGREGRIEFIAVALVPIIAFWGLDGYFLWQERLYRALYDHVRILEESRVDFSMNVSPFKTGRPRTWPSATFSRTLVFFYGALAAAVCLTTAIILTKEGATQWRAESFTASTTSQIAGEPPWSVTLELLRGINQRQTMVGKQSREVVTRLSKDGLSAR